jgi:hypothetical protein
MFDDLATYNFPIGSDDIISTYVANWLWYYGNPLNGANISSGPSEPSVESVYRAVTGSGYLTALSNSVSCSNNTSIWITNITAAVISNLTVNVTFTIAGGADDVLYDVYANSVLDFSTNRPWSWMGQGSHCIVYTLTNLPLSAAFLVLGTPLDSDQDGLTDAYERLVSKTNPSVWDSDGDGLGDGWEVQFGTNPFINDSLQTGLRLNYTYNPVGILKQSSGARAETIWFDPEGNVQQDTQ